MPKPILMILLSLVLLMTACGGPASSPIGTPPSTLQAATTTFVSPMTKPTLMPSASPTLKPAATVEPVVSTPDGLHVVYLREGDLWSWTETGGNVLLTDTGDLTAVHLSDDGQQLAFMRGPDVWTVRTDGTGARLLIKQKEAGGALWFAPNGSMLAVSTRDHIDVIDLANETSATVLKYPAIPSGIFPEVVWAADSSGFKTVILPGADVDRAEFLFVFPDGRTASLAKFAMVSPESSHPFISPDGGYVVYVAKLNNEQESIYIMDSSGAGRAYGEPGETIRLYGWLPDLKHFGFMSDNPGVLLLGSVTREPPVELFKHGYETIRWLDDVRFLAVQEGSLILANLSGETGLIAEDVSAFDFVK